jgi:hypothetical protein
METPTPQPPNPPTPQPPQPPRKWTDQPDWTTARLSRTVWITLITAFFAVPLGLAYGAWTIFQPGNEPRVGGTVSAYLVAGGLLCVAAGLYSGWRKREIERGESDLAAGPTYILAAFAAAAFGVWSAHAAATVHTPEASLISAQAPGSGQNTSGRSAPAPHQRSLRPAALAATVRRAPKACRRG